MTEILEDVRNALRATSTALYGINSDGVTDAIAEQLEEAQQSLYHAHAAVVRAQWLQSPHATIPLTRVKAQVMRDDAGRDWRYVESYGDMFDADPCIGCGQLLSDLFIGWFHDATNQFECSTCSGHPYYVKGTEPQNVCQRCYGAGFYEVVRARRCTTCGYQTGPEHPRLQAGMMPCGHSWLEWTVICDRLDCQHDVALLSSPGDVSGE